MDREEHDRVPGCLRPIDRLSGQERAGLVQQLQQLVLLAVEILHGAGGAAEIVGNQIIRRDRGADVRGRVAERRHVFGEGGMLFGETVHFLRGFQYPLERRAQLRPAETAYPADQTEIMQAGQIGEFLEAFERATHSRQIFAQIEPGGVVDELVIFIGLHVFAVEILVGLVIAHTMARPDQLLVVDRFEHRAGGHVEQQRIMDVGFESLVAPARPVPLPCRSHTSIADG